LKGETLPVPFKGQFEHTVDDRGRLAVPARYRSDFERGGVMTIAGDGCAELYTPEGFDRMSAYVAAMPRTTADGRDARRDFYGRAFDVELDKQGRILIPARVRQDMGLEGAVTIVGSFECFEVWNPARLAQHLSRRAASSVEQASGS
jgi:MraZ protein